MLEMLKMLVEFEYLICIASETVECFRKIDKYTLMAGAEQNILAVGIFSERSRLSNT